MCESERESQTQMSDSRHALILERDGVINADNGYIYSPVCF